MRMKQIFHTRKGRNRILQIVLTVIGSMCLLAGCGQAPKESLSVFQAVEADKNTAETETIHEKDTTLYLKLSHTDSENGFIDQAARILKEKLEQTSDGTMSIDIYPNDTLGTLDDSIFTGDNMVELRMGAASSTLVRVLSWLPVLSPDFDVTMLDRAVAEDGELREVLEQNSLETGARLLGVFPSTFRMTTSNRPLKKVQSIQGIKMRVIGEGLEYDLWELLGAKSKGYPISQTYLALQQGTVDSEENTFTVISGYRLYEQQKYLIHTNHKIYLDGLYVKESFYQGLTDEQQNMLNEAVDAFLEELPAFMSGYMERQENVMALQGVKHIYWDESERQKMMEIWREPVMNYLYEKYGDEMVEQAMSICHD